ncbi:MAG: hypothetical protein Kow00121_62030 [Elainellaceae cyanobacterium]
MQVQQSIQVIAPIVSLPPTALEIVQQVYARFTEGNLNGFLDLCADDIEWVVNGPVALVKCQTFRGKSGVSDFLDILSNTWKFHTFTPQQFIQNGLTVVVIGEETGIDQQFNQPFQNRWVHVFDVEQQQIVRFREFLCHWAGEQQPPQMGW